MKSFAALSAFALVFSVYSAAFAASDAVIDQHPPSNKLSDAHRNPNEANDKAPDAYIGDYRLSCPYYVTDNADGTHSPADNLTMNYCRKLLKPPSPAPY